MRLIIASCENETPEGDRQYIELSIYPDFIAIDVATSKGGMYYESHGAQTIDEALQKIRKDYGEFAYNELNDEMKNQRETNSLIKQITRFTERLLLFADDKL